MAKTKVKLTDICNQPLTLSVDSCGFWTLEDNEGNDLFIQSEDEQTFWVDYLIILNYQWHPLKTYLKTYLKRNDLESGAYDVRMSSDDWGMAIGTL